VEHKQSRWPPSTVFMQLFYRVLVVFISITVLSLALSRLMGPWAAVPMFLIGMIFGAWSMVPLFVWISGGAWRDEP
jgi:hypothetical protein